MAGPSLLIVDDADTVRTLVALQLRPALPGFAFRQAKNGLQGFEEIVASPPSAVLLDVNMPRLDGTTLLLLLKRARALAPAPLRRSLEGGAAAGGAASRLQGIDPATLRVKDPFHPRRGGYEEDDLDAGVEKLLTGMERDFGKDLEIPPDGLSLPAIPHYLVGETVGRPELALLPIVLLTTLARPGDRERFERLGPPEGYLPKPFDAGEAGRLISRLAGARRGAATLE